METLKLAGSAQSVQDPEPGHAVQARPRAGRLPAAALRLQGESEEVVRERGRLPKGESGGQGVNLPSLLRLRTIAVKRPLLILLGIDDMR